MIERDGQRPTRRQVVQAAAAAAPVAVSAGSTAARTPTGQSADVLQVVRDPSVEHDAMWSDANIGMRSCTLHLRSPAENAKASESPPQANVMIDGFSGRGIERLGSGLDEVAAKRPGIVRVARRGVEAVRTKGFSEASLWLAGLRLGYRRRRVRAPDARLPPSFTLDGHIAGRLTAAGIFAPQGAVETERIRGVRAPWNLQDDRFRGGRRRPHDPDRSVRGRHARRPPCPPWTAERSRTPGRRQEPMRIVWGGGPPEWRTA